ncbi:MAG: DNA internalization-related competence protein ComEC/Rec2 [Proteobacteria bacterium]|nr:DNA internalization-related competence protein ComEC/Rec2 [Pseudomonadota bacterium]
MPISFPKTWGRPLVPLAVAFATGVFLGERLAGHPAAALALTLSAGACCGARVLARAPAAIAPLVLFLGLGWLAMGPYTAPLPPVLASALDGGPVEISGAVAGPVDVRGRRVILDLDLETLSENGQARPASGTVRVTVMGQAPPLAPGDRLRFSARLHSPSNFGNPGGFDYKRYLRFRGVAARTWARSRDLAAVSAGEAPGPVERFRRRTAALIERTADGDAEALLQALVLGRGRAVGESLRDRFQRSGMAHLLAVSGLHVGMVALFVFAVSRWVLYRSERLILSGRALALAALLALAAAVFYGLVAGMSPSTRRAVVMAGALVAAWPLGRLYDPFSAVAAAALAILALAPPALFSLSFQLSFSAVLAILAGIRAIPGLRDLMGKKGLRSRVLSLVAMSLLATLGTLPLALRAFHMVSLVGPLVNPLAVPVVGAVVLPVGLAAALADPVFPWLGSGLMQVAAWGAGFVTDLATAASAVPDAAVMPVFPSVPETVLYYAVLASALASFRFRAARAVFAIALVLLAVDAGWWTWEREFCPDLRVTVLDVGQGSAACVEFPRGPVMVVDGGGFSDESGFDPGEDLVAPFLWSRKIRRVDILALSHPQQDHTAGLVFLAERFGPSELWTPGQGSDLPAFQRLLAACRRGGVRVLDVRDLSGGREISGVRVEALHPPPDYPARWSPDDDPNEFSLVLRLGLGTRALLLPGDLTGPGEDVLCQNADKGLSSDVVVAPHHGSAYSSGQEFLAATRPSVVIFSVGRDNTFGFPRPETLARYRDRGCADFTTGLDGAVRVNTDGTRLSVSCLGDRPRTWEAPSENILHH